MKFTNEETLKIATAFKKQFIANGLVAHVIKRKSGKNSFCYEIRYRSNCFEISAAANDLHKAKATFLQKNVPREIEKYRTERATKAQNYFQTIL